MTNPDGWLKVLLENIQDEVRGNGDQLGEILKVQGQQDQKLGKLFRETAARKKDHEAHLAAHNTSMWVGNQLALMWHSRYRILGLLAVATAIIYPASASAIRSLKGIIW